MNTVVPSLVGPAEPFATYTRAGPGARDLVLHTTVFHPGIRYGFHMVDVAALQPLALWTDHTASL